MARPSAKDTVIWYGEAKSLRSPYENDWRMAAAYCLPRHYSAWQTDGPLGQQGSMNEAARRFAYDSTGVNALPKYGAILNRLITPEGQRWHKLQASNPDLMKIYAVRAYFDILTDKLFKMRYQARARFQQTVGETYLQIGTYGMGPYTIGWRRKSPVDPKGGFSYKAWPLKDVFVLVDDEGNVRIIFRRFYLNARQFKEKFGTGQGVPPQIGAELMKPTPSETRYWEFVQCLYENGEYDKEDTVTNKRFSIMGSYLCVEAQEWVGEEDGYLGWPMVTPRTSTEPGDLYGYSPALQALPALGGVSAMKKTVLKQGQKAVDPAYLAHDDGVLSGRLDIRSGRVNYGGVNSQGNPLVRALETGNFNVAEKLIEDERNDIKDSFFVTLFTILAEKPEMTATQVMEEIAEKAALLAPTMGRLQSEMQGPQIEREITLLAEYGMLPEMPEELIEAQGEYNVVYTSPLAKGQYAEEVSGFMRWYEMLLNASQVIAAAGGTDLPTDWANLDEAAPEIADFMAVRTRWTNDKTKVVQIRDQRAQTMRESELIKQAPAGAAIAKEMVKSGGGVPGVSN